VLLTDIHFILSRSTPILKKLLGGILGTYLQDCITITNIFLQDEDKVGKRKEVNAKENKENFVIKCNKNKIINYKLAFVNTHNAPRKIAE